MNVGQAFEPDVRLESLTYICSVGIKKPRRTMIAPSSRYKPAHVRDSPSTLGQNRFNHPTPDVGQAVIAAGVTVREPFMVEAEQVQQGGVEVVNVNRVHHSAEAELVGGAVGRPALDAA